METVTVSAQELADLRKLAARWVYAYENLRIGSYYSDSMADCYCEFESMSPTEIDAAIAAEGKT